MPPRWLALAGLVASEGELLFAGTGSNSAHENRWMGWYSRGGTVEHGDGKRAAYDTLPLVGLNISDDSGAFAEYRLSSGHAGQSLLRIVQACMGNSRSNDGGGPWLEGHCNIGVLQAFSGFTGLSTVLRLGVGANSRLGYNPGDRDWALFLLHAGNGGGDFSGSAAYALGSEYITNTGHAGEVWIRGLAGSSTTTSSSTSSGTTTTLTASTSTTLTFTHSGELLFTSQGASSEHRNAWHGWFTEGGAVELGDGKRAAYDSLPLVSLQFSDTSSSVVSYRLLGSYAGRSLLQIVQYCMGSSRYADEGSSWDQGHCTIGTLQASSGRSGISSVLRVGVSGRRRYCYHQSCSRRRYCYYQRCVGSSNDWVLFMLEAGGRGTSTYAFGSAGRTNDGHVGQVWITGTFGTSTTTSSSTSSRTITTHTTSTLTVLGELLFTAKGASSAHRNLWTGWYEAGDAVEQGDGKTAAYDSLPLAALTFADDTGTTAKYELMEAFVGRSLLSIAQVCMGSVRYTYQGSDWPQGHCTIGTLESSSGRPGLSSVLRLGVGLPYSQSYSYCTTCWTLFMLEAGNGSPDFSGTFAFGAPERTNAAHAGQVWITGIFGTSTTTSSSTTSLFENGWSGWYGPEGATEHGDGKTAAYDSMPLSALLFADDTGFSARYRLVPPFEGSSLLEIVRSCVGGAGYQAGAGSRCALGELQNATEQVPEVLHLGTVLGRRRRCYRCWALFALGEGGEAFTLGAQGRASVGHAGQVWLTGFIGSSTRTTSSVTSTHKYTWPGWYNAGGFVEWGDGKSEAYDNLPVSGLFIADDTGFSAQYELFLGFTGRSLLQIVRACKYYGQCALGSAGVASTGHAGQVWIGGFAGTSTATSTSTTSLTTQTRTVLGELLFTAKGSSSAYRNSWRGWHNAGGAVMRGDGKTEAYDSLPVIALFFFDSDGRSSRYNINRDYAGMSLLQIVQRCMDGELNNTGRGRWVQGHCNISNGFYAGTLRIGVGTRYPVNSSDWVLFHNGDEDWMFGSAGLTNAGHSGQVWITGLFGTSTTTITATRSTTTTTTTKTIAVGGTLLFTAMGESSVYSNSWEGWYSEGGSVAQGDGKRASYDDLGLAFLIFWDNAGLSAVYRLDEAKFRGMSLLAIVQACMGQERRNDGGELWLKGHCVVGTLQQASGRSGISDVLRIGVGSANGGAGDWGLFMLEDSSNGFQEDSTYAFGSERVTNTGHNRQVWISGVQRSMPEVDVPPDHADPVVCIGIASVAVPAEGGAPPPAASQDECVACP